MGKQKKTKPFYPLKVIRGFLKEDPPRVEFSQRADGKADYTKLGLSLDEAIQELLCLTENDFKSTSFGKIKTPADEYKKNIRLISGTWIPLYVKFYIEPGEDLVAVISFHEDDKR